MFWRVALNFNKSIPYKKNKSTVLSQTSEKHDRSGLSKSFCYFMPNGGSLVFTFSLFSSSSQSFNCYSSSSSSSSSFLICCFFQGIQNWVLSVKL
ncbi:hypothetical protein VNO78_01205 [Psophocarpus tetragonolobus]|uniref:Uncharacterized protein n=1 Tax=Psophocarpus tetragonolobus TaxID=3891 RepID=A0AAN9T1E1_PSOTE